MGAANLKVFGASKLRDERVSGVIKELVHRYDLILLQEIRDISGESLDALMELVNRDLPQERAYRMLASAPLGTTSSKEKYAYLYDPRAVDIIDSWTVDGQLANEFERPPFCILFRSKVLSERREVSGPYKLFTSLTLHPPDCRHRSSPETGKRRGRVKRPRQTLAGASPKMA